MNGARRGHGPARAAFGCGAQFEADGDAEALADGPADGTTGGT